MFNGLTCSWFTRLVGRLVGWLSPCPEYLIKPYNAIFLKSPGSKDIKTDIPNCQIHKHTNTNSQIQLMTKCQKYPTIILEHFLFVSNGFPQRHLVCFTKYTGCQVFAAAIDGEWRPTFASLPHYHTTTSTHSSS